MSITVTFSSIASAFLTGALVAAAGAYLQHKYWEKRDAVETKRRDADASLKTVENITRSFESRYHAQLLFWQILKDRDPSEEDMTRYRSEIFKWMSEFAANKSNIRFYFGRDKMVEFETNVHDSLRHISDVMLRTKKLGYQNLSWLHQIEYNQAGESLQDARRSFFVFLRSLQEQIENGSVGEARRNGTRHPPYTDQTNWTLAQRLLGLKEVNSRAT